MKNWRRKTDISLVLSMLIKATRTNMMGVATQMPTAACRHVQPRYGLGGLRIILFLVN